MIAYRVHGGLIQPPPICADFGQHSGRNIKRQNFMQMADFQTNGTPTPHNFPPGHSGRNRVGEEPPRIICKKWLCITFGIGYNTGRTSKRLRKLVFDDRLLGLLQLNEQEWKKRQEFTAAESLIIINYLQL